MKWLIPLILTPTILLGQSVPKDEIFGIVRAFYLMMGSENQHLDQVSIYMYRSDKSTVFLKTYIYLKKPQIKGFIYLSHDKFEELKISDIVKLGASLQSHPKQIRIKGETFKFIDSLSLGPEVVI